MIYRYAIRKKGTDLYFPSGDQKGAFRRGFSWKDPEVNGGPQGPRLFLSLQSARNALTMWCQGAWKNEKSYSGMFSEEVQVDTVPTKPPEGSIPRVYGEYEFVPYRLVEDVSRYIEINEVNPRNVQRRQRRANARGV